MRGKARPPARRLRASSPIPILRLEATRCAISFVGARRPSARLILQPAGLLLLPAVFKSILLVATPGKRPDRSDDANRPAAREALAGLARGCDRPRPAPPDHTHQAGPCRAPAQRPRA